MKNVFPKSEYVEFPGAGHFLMMENPEKFNRLVIAFVDKLTRVAQ